MFEWPRFAAHLDGGHAPAERVASALAELARLPAAPRAGDVLASLFDDADLVQALERLAPHVDHVGLIAPPGVGVTEAVDILGRSPFRSRLREFRSTVLARDLSLRLGRRVDVKVVQGNAGAPAVSYPAVEVFVADLPAEQLAGIVAAEIGCHVALALAPQASLAQVLDVLHAHGWRENPLMRDGPLTNCEIHSSLLFVDVPGGERTRRLEFIASAAPE